MSRKNLDKADTQNQSNMNWLDHIVDEMYSGGTDMAPKGSGTEDSPYLIETADNLGCLILLNNYTESLFCRQTADINMSAYIWDGIGGGDKPFMGAYDGGGYTISGLNATFDDSSSPATISLFNYAQNSQIENVNVKNAYFSGTIAVGGGIVASGSGVTITNCTSDARIEMANDSLCDVYVGGIVGSDLDGAKITNCKYSGDIIVSGEAENIVCAGGIVGKSNGTTISNCIFDGAVVEQNLQMDNQLFGYPVAFVGGIIGGGGPNLYIYGADVSNCIVKGFLKGYFVGGLIGGDVFDAEVSSARNFTNCVIEALISTTDTETENGNRDILLGAFVGFNAADGANNFTACSFNGNHVRYDSELGTFGFQGVPLYKPTLTACYMAASDREKYISSESDDWGQYYRLVPGMNNDLPMQVGLYFIASAAPEMDSSQIVQSLKDKGFVERT